MNENETTLFGPELFAHLKQQLQEKHSLSAAQAAALVNFKNGTQLNERIRNQTLIAGDEEKIRDLDAALQKMPTVSVEKVYRFLLFLPRTKRKAMDFFKAHIGKTIYFPDFLSCSKGTKFSGYDFLIQIILHSPTSCRDMHTFWIENRGTDAEEKVAFTHRSCFLVLEVKNGTDVDLVLQETSFTTDAVEVRLFN